MYLVMHHVETLFQALADPLRVRILRLLAVTGEETCSCELTDSLLEPEENIVRHLNLLRHSGLLTASKEGRWTYYRLVQGMPHLHHLYAMVRELPNENQIFSGDLVRFQERLHLRQRGRCHTGVSTHWLRCERP